MLTTRRRSRQINGLARDRFIAPTSRPLIDVLSVILCLCLAIGCSRATAAGRLEIRTVAHRRVRAWPPTEALGPDGEFSRGQRRALATGRRGIRQAVPADAGRANGRDPRWPGAGAFRRGDWRDHDHAGTLGAGRFFLSRASLRRRRRLARGRRGRFPRSSPTAWSRSNSVR